MKQAIEKFIYWIRCRIFKIVGIWKKVNGYRYIVNTGSREIHNLSSNHPNCHLAGITARRYIREAELQKYLTGGFNGCRWCMKGYDTDMKKKKHDI